MIILLGESTCIVYLKNYSEYVQIEGKFTRSVHDTRIKYKSSSQIVEDDHIGKSCLSINKETQFNSQRTQLITMECQSGGDPKTGAASVRCGVVKGDDNVNARAGVFAETNSSASPVTKGVYGALNA